MSTQSRHDLLGRFTESTGPSPFSSKILFLVSLLSLAVIPSLMSQATESRATSSLTSISISAPDFTIYATSPSAVPPDGTTLATSNIIVLPKYDFTGTVTLSDLPLPADLTCTAINPAKISNGSGKATLSCSSAVEGIYEVTVIGTSGGLSHNSTATFTFEASVSPDFRISAVSRVSLASGASATSTITVTSLGGFDSQVNFTTTVYPSTGLSVSMNPQSLDGGGLSTATFSASMPGDYSVNITAASLSLSHTTKVVVDVTLVGGPDFEISAGSSTINIEAGNSGSTAITITSNSGFANSVALFVTTPAGVSCDLSPTSVQSSGTSTLTCKGSILGDFTVTVTGRDGANLHVTTVKVHVAAVSSAVPKPSPIVGLGPMVLYGLAGVVILAAVVVTVLLLRKSRPSRSPSLFTIFSSQHFFARGPKSKLQKRSALVSWQREVQNERMKVGYFFQTHVF